jgi:hypothetical protein
MKKPSPPLTTGYRLAVSSVIDERKRKQATRFLLETSQLFASFIYDLSVQEERQGNQFHFKVLGLKPPQLSNPSAGRARFQRDYEDLKGTFEVTVENIDGRADTFTLRISKGAITLIQAPREPFTELVL